MRQDPIRFEARQYMLRQDLEAFYYSDWEMTPVPAHRHNYHELLFFLEGSVTYRVGEEDCALLPGDLLVLKRDVPHHPVFTGPGRYRRVVLWLTEEFLRSLPQGETLAARLGLTGGSSQGPLFRFHAADADRLAERAMAIAEELRFERPMGDTMAAALTTELFVMLGRLVDSAAAGEEGSTASRQLAREVAVYVDDNLHRELTLDAIADRFFVSKFHLSRVFKRHIGLSPHAYITQRRLLLASQLLTEGLPPKEVATRCGYGDYSAFFRAFKEQYGVAPGKFSL